MKQRAKNTPTAQPTSIKLIMRSASFITLLLYDGSELAWSASFDAHATLLDQVRHRCLDSLAAVDILELPSAVGCCLLD